MNMIFFAWQFFVCFQMMLMSVCGMWPFWCQNTMTHCLDIKDVMSAKLMFYIFALFDWFLQFGWSTVPNYCHNVFLHVTRTLNVACQMNLMILCDISFHCLHCLMNVILLFLMWQEFCISVGVKWSSYNVAGSDNFVRLSVKMTLCYYTGLFYGFAIVDCFPLPN